MDTQENPEKMTVLELLIGYLHLSNAEMFTKVMTVLILRDDPVMLKMCHFLSDNLEATDKEIMAMAEKLAEQQDCSETE